MSRSLIRAPMEALWDHTQTPALHERWDLRFHASSICLRGPKRAPTVPLRDADWLRISGRWRRRERRGEGLADGSRSSALKFSSADARSIIREGSGYWKLHPDSGWHPLSDLVTTTGRASAPLVRCSTEWPSDL
mgnify:CR=1 FL=1